MADKIEKSERAIELVEHDKTWHSLFQQEAVRLTTILNNNLIALHHIGSTAIPGLNSKPVIDILGVVYSLEKVDNSAEDFEKLGYEVRGEYGIKGRRYFCKGANMRSHHLHIYQEGDPAITRYLQFRDYLMQHPEEKTAYQQLKQKLAEKFKHDHAAYCQGKTEFIDDICKKVENDNYKKK